MYVTNEFQGNDASQYDASSGVLSPLSPFTVAADSQPVAIAVTPDGKSAYVTGDVSDTVLQYAINPTTGALSPKTPATVAAGGDPVGIAVAPVRTCPWIFVGCTVGIEVGSSTATITSTLLQAAPQAGM